MITYAEADSQLQVFERARNRNAAGRSSCQAKPMTSRNTTTRDQHRRVIRRGQPPCGICGYPIDYSLHYLDPMAFVVDHIIPFGPNPSPQRVAELDVLENKQAAHRSCNRDKSDKTADQLGPRTFVTERTW